VMNLLKEVRERESCIEAEITPILDMYVKYFVMEYS
jgi:hypothetical protein